MICAEHSRYYCRWIGCYCLVVIQLCSVRVPNKKSIQTAEAKWKSKISRVAAASNNSKIITIQRSANECIIKINVSRVSRCHMPADKPTTANKPIENAMRIAVSMRTHDSYTQHDPSFCILGRLCLTLRQHTEWWLIDKDFMFRIFKLKCGVSSLLDCWFYFVLLLRYSHTVDFYVKCKQATTCRSGRLNFAYWRTFCPLCHTHTHTTILLSRC